MAVHGGLDYGELSKRGWSPEEVVDFSVSVYPLPLPAPVGEAFRWEDALRYPDAVAGGFLERLAAAARCPVEELLVTNGTSQAIHMIPRTLLPPRARVLIAGPTYGQYRTASEIADAEVTELRAVPEEGFRQPLEKIEKALRGGGFSALFLCDPNNPTGTLLEDGERKRLLELCDETETLLVMDEAYAAYLPEGSLAPRNRHRRLITLRSLTKDFGIPGLRLGYLHGPEPLIRKIAGTLPEWSINGPAQAVGEACLENLDEFKKGWIEVMGLKSELSRSIGRAGYRVYPGAANFFLTAVPDGAEWKRRLWERRILVRDCTSFGLPGFIRIGVKSREENNLLIEAMAELKKGF